MALKLETNESETDRLIRSVLAGLLVLAGFFFLEGALSIIAYVLAAILAITAVTGFCVVYALFGLSTCPAKNLGKRKKK